MSAVIILILRSLAVICLYLFLGFFIYILWKDLFRKENRFNNRFEKAVTINVLNSDKSYTFSEKEILIGRSEAAHVRLLDDEAVSNMHTRIFSKGNNWWVEDLQSTNGTVINGDPVVIPTIITSADQIKCGTTIVEIVFPDTQNTSAI
jgi:pSer/pThr/pTyr-binding forkhead associated (FHA) protein